MTWFYTFILIFSSAVNAAAPIEGGKAVSLSSLDYEDVKPLRMPGQRTCSGTRVTPTLVLTAAHCVLEVNGAEEKAKLEIGAFLPQLGKVVKIMVHPNYAAAKKAHHLNTSDKLLRARAILYDVAFIGLEEIESVRTRPYPKIISPETALEPRKKMNLAGYGTTRAVWNGKKFEYQNMYEELQVATNEWDECPLDYFGNEIKALNEFNKSLTEHLKIMAKRVHTIANGTEVVESGGRGLALGGDSGSPALERDDEGSFVVTGITSATYIDAKISEAGLEVEVDGKKILAKSLPKLPTDWGLSKKPDTEFHEIMDELKELNLLDESGKLKPGVTLKRKYTRVSEGVYSDLSHPDNQSFIKSIMPVEKRN